MTLSKKFRKLTREEFRSALAKGQGRALMHVRQYGLEDVKDLVLEACLLNQVWDQQIESGRGDWLFQMFGDSVYYEEFSTAILKALHTETDYRSLNQLCYLVYLLAVKDKKVAYPSLKEFVYHSIQSASNNSDRALGVEELLALEGPDGIVGIAELFGQYLIDDSEFFAFDDIVYFENFSIFISKLEENSHRSKAIERFTEYVKLRYQERSTKKVDDQNTRKNRQRENFRSLYSLKSILQDAENGVDVFRYVQFGKYATEDEIKIIHKKILETTDDRTRAYLLRIFRNTKLPSIEPIFFDWVHSDNSDLRSAMVRALSRITTDQIHKFAIEEIKSRESNRMKDYEAISLFENNYQQGDEKEIKMFLDSFDPGREETHEAGFALLELARINEIPELFDLVNWVYENTPCGCCRAKAVEWLVKMDMLPVSIKHECQFDANEAVRYNVGNPN